jgi:hypothetical protein
MLKTIMPDESEMLLEELRYLYALIFHRCPTNKILESYVRAHAEIVDFRDADKSQLKTVRIIVINRLDAIGIEPFFRGREIRHILSAKMLLLAYLAECEGTHSEFSHDNSCGHMALVSIFYAVIEATIHVMRGCIQKALYGLV